MTRSLLIGAALMLGAAAPVAAQAPVDFPAGSSVKVQFAQESEVVEGSLVSTDRESFVFRPAQGFQNAAYVGAAGQQIEASYKEVDVLWVDLGRSRAHAAWRGALWGGYLGAASGAVAGPLAAKSLDYSIGQTSAMLSVGAGLVSAGVGAVVGAILAPEHRWKAYRFVAR
jgi:hypothetical protein